MKTLITVVIILTAMIIFLSVVCLKWHISTKAIIYFMATKNYTFPSDEELEVCCKEAVKHWLKH